MLDFDVFVEGIIKPVPGEPGDAFFDNLFGLIPSNGCESAIRDAFADAINNRALLSNFLLVATHPVFNSEPIKAHCGMYAAGSRAIVDRQTDWTMIEVSIECEAERASHTDVADEVTSYTISDQWEKLLGRVTTSISLVFRYQLVTHHFSVLLLGDYPSLVESSGASHTRPLKSADTTLPRFASFATLPNTTRWSRRRPRHSLSMTTLANFLWRHSTRNIHGTSSRKCQMKEPQHYRLVVHEVGKPIREFSSGRQLVTTLSDCVFAHKEAYEKAKVIHPDISVGNMLIVPEGKDSSGVMSYRGVLTDWELSKGIEERDLEARHPDRMGTWQFMSVNNLNMPRKQVDGADDLESFLYVLFWCAIGYLPHNCSNVGDFMYYFFDHGETADHKEYSCGLLERLAIEAGYLVTNMQKRVVFLCKPLSTAVPVDISKKDRHPIHEIVTALLRRFVEFYKAQQHFLEAQADGETNHAQRSKHRDAQSDALGASHLLLKFEREDFAAIKALVNSHDASGELLADFLYETGWPEHDCVADQLDPEYRPDKEDKTCDKREREEEKPAEPESKRPCSDTSRA
ncbi:hypothetical protein GY45DRAFT_1359932 [Cubamyces sp. BRFM 1775]|nr:hypothetical protein GY45DRAFT_1359932 [Cubamyces sp. BRFM 1775]